MQIVVCIKQVPDSSANVVWTKSNTIAREYMQNVINPYDIKALKWALSIKDKFNTANVSAISMGPNCAKEILEFAIALGCDDGFLVCDKKFAGSDTLATAKILQRAIETKFKTPDLIVCGQFATDGDTGQTGPIIAKLFDIPKVTFVEEILEVYEEKIVVKRQLGNSEEIVKIKLPALLCISGCKQKRRPIFIEGFERSQNKKIEVLSNDVLKLGTDEIGLLGSPTVVRKTFKLEQKTHCNFVNDSYEELILKEIEDAKC